MWKSLKEFFFFEIHQFCDEKHFSITSMSFHIQHPVWSLPIANVFATQCNELVLVFLFFSSRNPTKNQSLLSFYPWLKKWNKWLNISECWQISLRSTPFVLTIHNMNCFLIHNVLSKKFTFAPHKQTICANQKAPQPKNERYKKKMKLPQTTSKKKKTQTVFDGTKNK